MQVCYITNGLKMGHYHYAWNFLSGLSTIDDISVDAFYLDDGGDAVFPGTDSARPLATSTSEFRSANILTTTLLHGRFLSYLLRSRPDVVHFNAVFRNQYHTYALTRLANLTEASVVRTVHEVTAERIRDVSDRERSFAYRQLEASDHLIVHSDAVTEEVRDAGISTTTTVLPHGNYLFFREHLKEESEPPLPTDGKPVVLFFGPKAHKGIDVFADAVEKIGSQFTIWIAGAVAEDAESAVARLKQHSNVYIERSYIPDEELPQYFEHADIVPLPYVEGTTSGAVHLARAFETAVITSDLPYFRSVVDHGIDGYVLKETTPESLSSALDELLASPELAVELASAGLETEHSARYDWGRIAWETVSAYRASD